MCATLWTPLTKTQQQHEAQGVIRFEALQHHNFLYCKGSEP